MNIAKLLVLAKKVIPYIHEVPTVEVIKLVQKAVELVKEAAKDGHISEDEKKAIAKDLGGDLIDLVVKVLGLKIRGMENASEQTKDLAGVVLEAADKAADVLLDEK